MGLFSLVSYFDCSDLQLIVIFMAEKLVAPRCVQIARKRKQNPLLKLACTDWRRLKSALDTFFNDRRMPWPPRKDD